MSDKNTLFERHCTLCVFLSRLSHFTGKKKSSQLLYLLAYVSCCWRLHRAFCILLWFFFMCILHDAHVHPNTFLLLFHSTFSLRCRLLIVVWFLFFEMHCLDVWFSQRSNSTIVSQRVISIVIYWIDLSLR